jgi:hypothetical protein
MSLLAPSKEPGAALPASRDFFLPWFAGRDQGLRPEGVRNGACGVSFDISVGSISESIKSKAAHWDKLAMMAGIHVD